MTVLHKPTTVWLNAFTDVDREQQLRDDAVAWNRVAGVLMVVIIMGLVISVVGVMIAMSI